MLNQGLISSVLILFHILMTSVFSYLNFLIEASSYFFCSNKGKQWRFIDYIYVLLCIISSIVLHTKIRLATIKIIHFVFIEFSFIDGIQFIIHLTNVTRILPPVAKDIL